MLHLLLRSNILRLICLFLFISVLFTNCASKILKSVEQTDNPTLEMVIARNMISQTKYNIAQKILYKIKEENPYDAALHIEIDYEDAYIDFSKKKYNVAKDKFEKIIAAYDNDTNNALPKWTFYLSKKLVENNINPILEKRAARKAKLKSKKSQSIEKQ